MKISKMLSVSNNESSSDLIILNANELLWTVGQKYTYRLICKYINTTKMTSWCQRRMGRLVRDNRKATVTQITTRYNQDMQNTISERTTRRSLKQMSYSSRRPHRVPLLSAKNRKRRLQFTQVHQNWTIQDWKNVAWSDESRFLLRHSRW